MSEIEYAIWTAPDLSVAYALPAFHEIDFTVNEGFRRIPHGGIETGGLLYGTRSPGRIQIEAFRPIECEHAFGPSFQLSERDIDQLEEQIRTAPASPELRNLAPVGWFIAHTRSDLVMNDREAAIFDRFFPEPGAVTVLVKPEKFKPTRFAFLPRHADGSVARDGTQSAVILPLPGRAGRIAKPEGEPAMQAVQSTPVIPPDVERSPAPLADAYATEVREPEPTGSIPVAPEPTFSVSEPRIQTAPPLSPTPVAFPPPKTEQVEFPRPPKAITPTTGILGQALAGPEPPIYERARQRQQFLEEEAQAPGAWGTLHWVLLALMLVCAAVVGWGVYLRMQSAFIPMQAISEERALKVSWPSNFTRDAEDSTVRVNDGIALALPEADRVSGTTVVPLGTGDSVKVELVVHQWLRNGHGIVRFVQAPATPSVQKPANTPARRTYRVPRSSTVPARPVFPAIGSEGLTQPGPQAAPSNQ